MCFFCLMFKFQKITSFPVLLSKISIFHNVFKPTFSADEIFKRSFVQAIGEIVEVIIQNENANNFSSNIDFEYTQNYFLLIISLEDCFIILQSQYNEWVIYNVR